MSDNHKRQPDWPLGVFTRLEAKTGVSLEMAGKLGVPTIHLHVTDRADRGLDRAAEVRDELARLGIAVSCVFAGFEGESYADIPTVRRTVGLAPADLRASRTKSLIAIADFAQAINSPAVGLHLGFVPHDSNNSEFRALVEVTQKVCDHCAADALSLHLETGQEPVEVLLEFIQDVGRENLFVNFDPANMILYGAGEPLPALEALGRHVRSVHCKDGTWSDQPGKSWGRETPLGEGDVNMEAFLAMLRQIGYRGPLTVERENYEDPVRQFAEVKAGLVLLERLKRELAA